MFLGIREVTGIRYSLESISFHYIASYSLVLFIFQVILINIHIFLSLILLNPLILLKNSMTLSTGYRINL